MSIDSSNQIEAEKLFTQALKIDPSNETVLTMFAIFKCNQYFFFFSSDFF
jgi:cytochrome c-type biogenesis protein CcmH/NrfG